MNILGLDWGKAKIGIALGSDETKIASPILILENNGEWLDRLKRIIVSEMIGIVVIGKPVSLKGDESMSHEFEYFVRQVKKLGKKIVFEDERLSTKLAQGLMRDFKKTKRAQDDDVAATVILQSYLDKL
ncbi:Holliday junction resolvase RuvX [Candidatus Falkowbacteria bacterium]|jgi:putative holliday junction resolvase|nr:Holliday junction resolvase RuvX [Candidatus Falkowbacteria bacterium]MBT5503010.1 Holliday junction resolvase RuvX [Candidatus Falkowbacteria bacterium]MBT6574366.1 Holliday junction resolvase RuvX [Candidatus Falkowbacteria bacterium]MBT7349041.1 Holliday junction resolvase RuvX [Candidatus Falkowbacteria bacterium]MBT7500965.1 Holliday junction resolvase RuvX [Candidatus Falkowbacteria bacterium]